MIMRSLLAGLSVACILSVPAFAFDKLELRKGETVATLTAPLKSPKDPVIDGRIWHCEGATCRVSPLSTAHAAPLSRECADAAKQVGAFASYQTGPDTVEGAELAKCNAEAHKG